ncbi:MAG: CBS domain-containing protein [Lewinella sp.]|nr:CBS domain-containing protein [Lewinella sp.]
MNLLTPVAKIMSKQLHTVSPDDSLEKVKSLFDEHNIHHVPVVRYKEIVGIISSTDFNAFLHGFAQDDMDKLTEESRLRACKAEEIMTTGLAKVESTDTLSTVLGVFLENRFRALPVVEGSEIIGIVTTFDIIRFASEEPIRLEDYKK